MKYVVTYWSEWSAIPNYVAGIRTYYPKRSNRKKALNAKPSLKLSEAIVYADIDPGFARQKHLVKIPGKHEVHWLKDRRPEMYHPAVLKGDAGTEGKS